VKHIQRITSGKPAPASLVEEVICIVADTLDALIVAFGGSSPIIDLIANDKCTFPTPDDSNDTGSN